MNKKIITIVLVFAIIFGFFFGSLLLPDKTTSVSERRPLEQMPKLSVSSLFSGRFMNDFRDYTADQFPLRDFLRTVKAHTSQKLFNMSDNNGYYFADGHLSEMMYPLNEKSITRAAGVFENIYNRDLKNNCNNIYLAVIPDKNYCLANKSGHLALDYALLAESLKQQMPYAKYIDLYDLTELSGFYKTDLHVTQERAAMYAERLNAAMGAEFNGEFKIEKATDSFYGVYSGHSALNTKPDQLYYLTNQTIENCKVYDYETDSYLEVYNLDAVKSDDAYSMFLHGSKSLLRVENPNCNSNKKLIIFRDSFASNISPLMMEGYSEITLVDIRYISATLLNQYIDFEGQDVLFLYSTPVLNNSNTLKN